MRDTVPLVMKADGIDPAEATNEDWLAAIDKIGEAVDSGQIRRFTGNDYTEDLTSGNVVASIGWSGDALPDRPTPTSSGGCPTRAATLWSDNMVIPVGAPNTAAALEFMNFVYEPEVQADIAELRQLRDAGRRRQGDPREERPEAGREPADLPRRGVHRRLRRRPAEPAGRRRRRAGGRPEASRGRCVSGLSARMTRPCAGASSPTGCSRPGAIWLVLFFVVPMYFMGELALRSGIARRGLRLHLGVVELPRRARRPRRADRAHVLLLGRRDLLALLIAYPLAYAIALKASPRWRLLLLFAVIAPFFTTYLIRTIAWKTILADASPIVDVLQFLAIVPDDGRVLATVGAVIAGLTYNFLPFMILPIYASLERIDLQPDRGGKDLYASARQAFLRVTLPLTAPGIVAGVLLTFIPAFGDYVNAAAPRRHRTSAMIGNKIQSLYLDERNYPEAAALSFLMMAAILIVVLVYIRARRDRGVHGRRRGGRRRVMAWLRSATRSMIYAGLAVAYMLVPIAVIAVFSFGETPRDRLNFALDGGFTLEYWKDAFSIAELNDALLTSLELAALSTLIATAIGTADGARAGPPPVLRPARREPADRAADGDARDRDRRRAALDVRRLRDPARLHDAADRARDVLDQLRRRRRPLAADRLRPQLEEAAADLGATPLDDVPPRDPAAARARGDGRRRCSPSPSRSTTS